MHGGSLRSDLSVSAYRWALGLLVGVRMAMVVALVFFYFPDIQFHDSPNRWFFSHGGDEGLYYDLTKAVVDGRLLS